MNLSLLELHLGNKNLTHEGSDAAIAAVIQELGRLVSGCNRIAALDLVVQYTDGETYLSPLTDLDIHTIQPFDGEVSTTITFQGEVKKDE